MPQTADRKDRYIVMRKKQKLSLRPPRSKVDLLGKALELPPGALGKGAHIELSSNREATVDGCKGVMEYEETRIKLNIGTGSVTFLGRNLEITNLLGNQTVIAGFITGLEFTM